LVVRGIRQVAIDTISIGPLSSHTGVVLGNQMLIYGGTRRMLHVSDVLYIYDFALSTWSSSQVNPNPGCLEGHTAVPYKDSMIVFGGINTTGQLFRYADELWEYSTASQQWLKWEIRYIISREVRVDSHPSGGRTTQLSWSTM
jgi:hypothetical protein